ncbi:MAG: repair protein RecN [Actinomycetota bacterium]|jgi:DNA repair protein RecN (Recombination protein N)
MINEIYIRDLGVIREARLPFKPGLNVLTGETGAGKTMVLTALGLLLGERSDAAAVRFGSNQALVEGRWSGLPSGVATRVQDAGATLEDDELLANRTVSNEGKSRASLGGVSVPVGLLGEIGNQLVVVHGQSDQIRLKSAAAQREALDLFAQIFELLADYREQYNSYKKAEQNLNLVLSNKAANAAELSDLLSDLEEIEKIAPKPGEDVELADLANRLSNVEALRAAAVTAHEALSSEQDQPDVNLLIAAARRSLEQQSSNDSTLNDLAQRLQELGYQAADVAGQLASYIASLDGDSELSLDEIQSRRAQLNVLLRKHGPTLENVFEFSEAASKRVLELDDSDERVEQLRAEIASSLSLASKLAEEISARRLEAAVRLSNEVNQELAGLAMAGAQLVVEVTAQEDLGPHGKDQVSLMLRSYAGSEPRPISKGASGGELSRIMLALEVVLAKGLATPTFIFDEVDAGVGGAAAIEVGKRLARLSKDAQVIVVTHLAQVAAFADNHLRVLKSSAGDVTESDVETLSGEAREAELARMLSGLSDSATAREHAIELMSLAKATSDLR